jgi:hypothetical protein
MKKDKRGGREEGRRREKEEQEEQLLLWNVAGDITHLWDVQKQCSSS